MKYKVILNGQEIIEGAMFDDVVAVMSTLQWPDPKTGKPVTPPEYMRDVAERVKTHNGIPIRTDSEQHFIEDLEAAGVIARVDA